MRQEKKLWLLEQYAQKIWTLSVVLAQEVARADGYGKGFAVVVDETSILADKLFDLAAKARFEDNLDIYNAAAEMALMTKFLYVNTLIETAYVAKEHKDLGISKNVAVFVGELNKISNDLNELSDRRLFDKPFTLPEPAEPVDFTGELFCYTIGGYQFYEDILNIKELCYLPKADTEKDSISPGGLYTARCVNYYNRFGLNYTGFNADRSTTMILHTRDGGYIAVPVDDMDINPILYNTKGENVPPDKNNVFAAYARECWNAVGGGQFLALDFTKR